MSELAEALNSLMCPGFMTIGARTVDDDYSRFKELALQAKSLLDERNFVISWTDEPNVGFRVSTPFGVIYGKQHPYFDDGEVRGGLLFYFHEEGAGKPVDLCAVTLGYGKWRASNGSEIADAYGQAVPGSAVTAITAALKEKLRIDHERFKSLW